MLVVEGLSIRMERSLRKTPTCEGARRASSFYQDSGCTHSRRAGNRRVPSAPRLLGPPALRPALDLLAIPEAAATVPADRAREAMLAGELLGA